MTVKIIPEELRKAHLYLMVSHDEVESKRTREGLRKELIDFLMKAEKDEDGNYFYEFPDDINFDGITYSGLQAQRRVSEYVNDDTAMEIIKAHGLEERCLKTVTETVIDYDEVYAANQEGTITDEEVDSIIESDITYALVKVKR